MKRTLNGGLVLLMLLGLCGAPSRADRLSEDRLLSDARSAAEYASSKLRALEPRALAPKALGGAEHPDSERQGTRLVLRLRSGKTKIYVDRAECGKPEQEADCERFSLVAHARTRGVFVVVRLQYEGLDCILLDDRTAQETVLRNLPTFSPSGQRALVLLENDPALGFVVQIWRRDAGHFVLEWSGSPNSDDADYVSYKLLKWSSEDIIEVQSTASLPPPKPDVVKTFTLRLTAEGWKVQ